MSPALKSNLDRALALLGVALVTATGVVVVTSSGAPDDAGAMPASAKAVDRVPIVDFKYAPEAITVAVGTKITWINRDAAPHTATSGASPLPDGLFDTGILRKGERKAVKVSKRGTFAYYCELHPFMKGTLIVT